MPATGALNAGQIDDTGLPLSGASIYASRTNSVDALADANDGSGDWNSTNSSGNYQGGRGMTDTPSDFGSMDSLNYNVRVGWASAPSNSTCIAGIRVMASNGTTVLAANDGSGNFQTIVSADTATYTNRSGAFSYVNTSATKTDWDGALVQTQVARSRTKGGDSINYGFTEANVSGLYSTGVDNRNAALGNLAWGTSLAMAARKGATKALGTLSAAAGFALGATTQRSAALGANSATVSMSATGQASQNVNADLGDLAQASSMAMVGAKGGQVSGGTGQAPTYVQRIAGANTKASGATLALTVPGGGVAAGSSVIVLAYWRNAPATLTVTDTQGNTYTKDDNLADDTSSMGLLVYRADNITALVSGNTITLDSGQGTDTTKLAIALEVTGLQALDKLAHASGTSTTPDSGSTATTTVPDSLAVGVIAASSGTDVSTVTLTSGESWTTVAVEGTTGGGTNGQLNPGHKVLSSTGAYKVSGDISPSSVRWVASILVYAGTAGTGDIAQAYSMAATGVVGGPNINAALGDLAQASSMAATGRKGGLVDLGADTATAGFAIQATTQRAGAAGDITATPAFALGYQEGAQRDLGDISAATGLAGTGAKGGLAALGDLAATVGMAATGSSAYNVNAALGDIAQPSSMSAAGTKGATVALSLAQASDASLAATTQRAVALGSLDQASSMAATGSGTGTRYADLGDIAQASSLAGTGAKGAQGTLSLAQANAQALTATTQRAGAAGDVSAAISMAATGSGEGTVLADLGDLAWGTSMAATGRKGAASALGDVSATPAFALGYQEGAQRDLGDVSAAYSMAAIGTKQALGAATLPLVAVLAIQASKGTSADLTMVQAASLALLGAKGMEAALGDISQAWDLAMVASPNLSVLIGTEGGSIAGSGLGATISGEYGGSISED
jgi:hypothetical protein